MLKTNNMRGSYVHYIMKIEFNKMRPGDKVFFQSPFTSNKDLYWTVELVNREQNFVVVNVDENGVKDRSTVSFNEITHHSPMPLPFE